MDLGIGFIVKIFEILCFLAFENQSRELSG
jgi:hypothetical protein